MNNKTGYTHWVVVILISVIALGLVGLAWWYEENNIEENTPSTIETNIATPTNSRNTFIANRNIDEHGCDVANGLYWCELSQTCINHAYVDCTVTDAIPESQTTETNSNVNELKTEETNTNTQVVKTQTAELITVGQGLINMEISAAGANDSAWLIGGKSGKLAYYENGSWIDLSSKINDEIVDITAIGWNSRYWLIAAGQKIYTYNGEQVIMRTDGMSNGIRVIKSITWTGSYWLLSGEGSSIVGYDENFTLRNPIGIEDSTAYSSTTEKYAFVTTDNETYQMQDYRIIVTSFQNGPFRVVNLASGDTRTILCGYKMNKEENGVTTQSAAIMENRVPSPPGLFQLDLPQETAVCGQWVGSNLVVSTEKPNNSNRYWKINTSDGSLTELIYSVQGAYSNEIGTIAKTKDGWIVAGNEVIDGKKRGVILHYTEE